MNISIRYVLLVALLGLMPISASAATVYLESSRTSISVGDTIIVSAKINAEGKTINTVDGDIVFKTNGDILAVQEFSLANSAFDLWPRTPSLSNDGQTMSFVGGVPGGFNIEEAILFKIIFEAKKTGSVTLTPQNVVVYASDGKGTKLPVQIKDIVINVGPKKAGTTVNNEWNTLVARDTIAPEDFVIVPGEDKSLFDGKKFVFFSALDNQSGISHYEVSEDGAPVVRSGSTYVLQNQSGNIDLNVTAFDKAGNKKAITYTITVPTKVSSFFTDIPWSLVILIVLVFIILGLLIGKMRKSKNNVPTQV